MQVQKKKPPIPKRESLFLKVLNRLLKLKFLKVLNLSLGLVKGFAVRLEFFEDNSNTK